MSTISPIRQASYIFNGKSLENMDRLININCASDSHTDSFDIAIHSKVSTKLDIDFNVIPSNSIADVAISPKLRSMYTLAVHYAIKAFSSKSYPIQMKAPVRRVIRNNGSVLHVNSSSKVEYSIRRCGWELPGREIYDQKAVGTIIELIEHTCEDEWLSDTVNILIKNDGPEEIYGNLFFKLSNESHPITEPISIQPIQIGEQIQALSVIKPAPKDDYFWPMIIGSVVLFGILVYTIYSAGRYSYNRIYRYQCYEVAKRERKLRIPVAPSQLKPDIEMFCFSSIEDVIYSL